MRMRTDRDRAIILFSILAVFLGAWVVLVLSGRFFADITSKMLPALSVWVSIGVTILVTTFSFVFVALSLVSVQFSPRIVRHFWHRDRFRAVFLWSSISVCGFCFLIQFVDFPALHALGLFLGAYQTFVLFPTFLGYLADNLNAASITKNIADRTVLEIDAVYSPLIESADDESLGVTVVSNRSGFLEKIDADRLVAAKAALDREITGREVRVVNYLGSFVEVGSPLLKIEPPSEISESTAELFRISFSIQKFRSFDQDVEYGVRQLVDIGIKAISPAVNDPTTCVNCIHYLGVIIKELASRDLVSQTAKRLATHGIITKEPTFEQYVDDAFDQIYHFGRRDYVIVKTLVSVLSDIATATTEVDRLNVLMCEVDEMELTFLLNKEQEQTFEMAEHRNYVRKSLSAFYRTVSEQYTKVDDLEMSNKASTLSSAYSESMEHKSPFV